MSSDLLNITDDENGNSIFLTMKSTGCLLIEILDKDNNVLNYKLDTNDVEKTKEILNSLNSWLNHKRNTEKI